MIRIIKRIFGFFNVLIWLVLLGRCGLASGQVLRNDSVGEDPQAARDLSRLSAVGERVLDFVTWERQGRVLVLYPSGGFSPRNGLELGVTPALSWQSDFAGKVNTLTLGVEGSTGGMLQFQSEYEWFFHEHWQSRGEVTWNRRHDRFWPTEQAGDFSFDRRELMMKGELLRQISPKLWGGLALQGSSDKISNFENPEEIGQTLPGLGGGTLLGAGPLVLFDSRNRVLSPQQGLLLRAQYLFFGPAHIGDYFFRQWTVDGRCYLRVNELNSVVAFQVLAESAGEEVPFYQAPFLGGKDRLRGIGHPLRSTGLSVWMARGEYRQPLWWRVGAVVFAGAGRAASDFHDPFSHLTGSVGGGLRFRLLPHDPLNVRMDYGVSSLGDSGFFISLKEAF